MTGLELITVWEERDRRYHTRPRGARNMEKASAGVVHLVRSTELMSATAPGVTAARRYLLAWEPPFQEKQSVIPQAITNGSPHPLTVVASPEAGPRAHNPAGGS